MTGEYNQSNDHIYRGFMVIGDGQTEPDAWDEFVSDICVEFDAPSEWCRYWYWRSEQTLHKDVKFDSDTVVYRYHARILSSSKTLDSLEAVSLDGIEKHRQHEVSA